MNTHANKTQNKSQSVANAVSQSLDGSEPAVQFADNRPGDAALRRLQEIINNSGQSKQLSSFQKKADASPQAQQIAQLKASANHYTAQQQPLTQKKENKTGLPDNLKAGIENLSGYAMDDVKVHYNSAEPALLSAHAYAQGSDIHVAPGQEKHLAHEAWHVVQQKQGRVKPTLQLKSGIYINDDAGLEKEADSMTDKVVAQPSGLPHLYRQSNYRTAAVVQQMPLAGFRDIVREELKGEYGDFLIYFKNDYEDHERMGAFYTGERMYRNWTEYVQDPAFTEDMLRNLYIAGFRSMSEAGDFSPVVDFTPDMEEKKEEAPKPWQKKGPQKKGPDIIERVPTKHEADWSYFEKCPLFPRALGNLDTPIQDQVRELDIVQGALGDCWLLATVGAIAIKSPEDLIQLIQEVRINGEPTPKRIFNVKVYANPGRPPVDILVDSSLPISKGNLLYAGKGKGVLDHFSLYLPLIEKAIAGREGKSAGYGGMAGHGAQRSFALLTGDRPVEIQIAKLHNDEEQQMFVAKNKGMPMTISGKRRNPPKKQGESRYEPHDMVVLDTNGRNFTIYDQSARPKHRIIRTSIDKMIDEVDAKPYSYIFDKLNIAKTHTRIYGEGAALFNKLHIDSELYLLQRMEVAPDITAMFRAFNKLEHDIKVFEVTTELDLAVLEERLRRLEALLSAFR